MANDHFFVGPPTKRPAPPPGTIFGPPDPKKSKPDASTNDDKNPVSILNELRTGLKYNLIEQCGPSHAPIFKVGVQVDGQTYYGVGGSKKSAKCKAAQEALKSFIQFPNNKSVYVAAGITAATDFTSDAFEGIRRNATEKQTSTGGPVMLLNQLYPNVKYECIENDGCIYSRFKVTADVAGERFFGTGSSKKRAKNSAAKAALSKLNFHVDGCPDSTRGARVEEQERADYIGRLIQDKFAALMSRDPTHSRRKVLAGIVMSNGDGDGGGPTEMEVVAVATGTKCVSGEHMSINGCSLNDMHAEIVSRRCLVRFLYDQLDLVANNNSIKSIFEPRDDGMGYRLKRGLEFHLYINTAPCGDARVFSPHEEDGGPEDKHPKRGSRGLLRTKIESGEGTIPVKANVVPIQTWDGILQGERLLTMSCSDKICRWNVVGLQGALLSHFVEPIYLKSIVLGSLMRESHLQRAIFGRIEGTLQGLDPPFRLNRPSMCSLTSNETRHPGKAPTFSVVWYKGMEGPELVNTNVGKTETGISRFCKRELAKRFVGLIGKISSITRVEEEMEMPPTSTSYCEAKEAVLPYKMAKESLYRAFVKAGLGSWISKPLEQDMFELSSTD